MGRRTHWIKSTVDTIAGTITASLIPRCRQTDLWDLAEIHAPAYASQAIDCTVRAIWDETERALFPAIAIDRGEPTPEQKRKRFDNLSRRVRRCVLLFIAAYVAYAGAAVQMLSETPNISFFAIVLQSVVLAMALRLQRGALTPAPVGRSAIPLESIDPERYPQELRRKKDMLILGDFSPSKSALRSGAIALMLMLIFFAPAYPVLRWLDGGPLPDGVGWVSILCAFVMACALVAWFLFIWISSRLTADAFQREIDALDAGEEEALSS